MNQQNSIDREEAKFREWMRQVDTHLVSRIGFESADLPDQCYRDWFEDGISPKRAAGRTISAFKRGE